MTRASIELVSVFIFPPIPDISIGNGIARWNSSSAIFLAIR